MTSKWCNILLAWGSRKMRYRHFVAKMDSYSWQFFVSVVISLFLKLCPISIQITIYFCIIVLVYRLPRVEISSISAIRMVVIYFIITVPFLSLFVFSKLLNLLCDFILTWEVPWIKLWALECFGLFPILC